jgi:hypothetical protein
MSARGFLDDFHNIVFKIKLKFYTGLRFPIPNKMSGFAYDYIRSSSFSDCQIQSFMEEIWLKYDAALGFSAPLYLTINVSREYGPRCKAESHTCPSSDKSFQQFSNVRHHGIRWKDQKKPTKRPVIAGLACMILGSRLSNGKQKRKTLNCDTASYS